MTKKKLFTIIILLFTCFGFAQTGSNWKLVFEDNFDGSNLSSNNWSYCSRMTSDWNKYLKSSTETVQVLDGNLCVKAIKNTNLASDNVPYLTGGIQSKGKFNFKYGKIEVRAKLSNGKGSWPAIWLMPEDGTGGWPACGEIDIMERINTDTYIYQTIHSYYGNTLGITNPTKSKTAAIINNDYNIYGLEWYPDRLDFTVNGTIKFTYPRITTDKQGQWPFDKAYYIILNQAAGGSWAGSVTESELPFQMQVDYVKVYSRDDTQPYITPAWSGIYAQDNAYWKNTYVNEITSTGAANNVNYSVTARPASFYTIYPDTIKLVKNQNFSLNLKAYSLGVYSESIVKQDVRYTCSYAFADFDGDKLFETTLPRIGNVPPTNGVGGNFNVLNATHTFITPANSSQKTGRIRIVYRNAWSEVLSPDMDVKEGLVYDFNVKIVEQPSNTREINFSIAVQCKGNTINISGLIGKTVITLIDCTGKIISQNTTNSQEISFNNPKDFIILRVQNESSEIYTQKIIR